MNKYITPLMISYINQEIKKMGHSIFLVLTSPCHSNNETVEIIVNDSWINLNSSLNLTDEFYDFVEIQLKNFGIKNIMYNNDKTIFWVSKEND